MEAIKNEIGIENGQLSIVNRQFIIISKGKILSIVNRQFIIISKGKIFIFVTVCLRVDT